MSYCEINDIKGIVPEDTLAQLTDDEDGTVINDSIITEAITYVSAIIDGYLRGRYSLPLSSVPEILNNMSKDFVVYRLYSRRMFVDVPENIFNRYKEIQIFLRDIQSCKMSLGIEDIYETEGNSILTNKDVSISSDNKQYTSEIWDSYL